MRYPVEPTVTGVIRRIWIGRTRYVGAGRVSRVRWSSSSRRSPSRFGGGGKGRYHTLLRTWAGRKIPTNLLSRTKLTTREGTKLPFKRSCPALPFSQCRGPDGVLFAS